MRNILFFLVIPISTFILWFYLCRNQFESKMIDSIFYSLMAVLSTYTHAGIILYLGLKVKEDFGKNRDSTSSNYFQFFKTPKQDWNFHYFRETVFFFWFLYSVIGIILIVK